MSHDDNYFKTTPGGRWAASRLIEGRWIALIQDSSLYDPCDAAIVLSALRIPESTENLDTYFPHRKNKGRCPTLDLLELFSHLPPGQGRETGV